jgi:hypothetical protein
MNAIKYGISEIDTNFELKKFIVQHNERRLNVKNRLQYDVGNFMKDLVKVKESAKSSLKVSQLGSTKKQSDKRGKLL